MSRPQSLPSRILSIALRRYLTSLRTSPLLTKSVTSATLSFLSSLLASHLSHTPPLHSAALHELCIGLLLRGPAVHAFHTALDAHLGPNAVLTKLALDQGLFAPALTVAYIFLDAAFRDVPLAVTRRKVRRDILSIMQSNWAVWVPANLVGYAIVPLEFRTLWGSLVGVAWGALLIRKVKAAEREREAAA